MILGLGVWAYFNFMAPTDIPAIWYGLLASLFGLLFGTFVWPKTKLAE
jgi:hypothetical protein